MSNFILEYRELAGIEPNPRWALEGLFGSTARKHRPAPILQLVPSKSRWSKTSDGYRADFGKDTAYIQVQTKMFLHWRGKAYVLDPKNAFNQAEQIVDSTL
jgi:hypothetical protein